jgi:hypothetical protein
MADPAYSAAITIVASQYPFASAHIAAYLSFSSTTAASSITPAGRTSCFCGAIECLYAFGQDIGGFYIVVICFHLHEPTV